MTKEKLFFEDLQKIYILLQERQKGLNSFYDILKGKEDKKKEFIDNFLTHIKLPLNKETRVAAINRLVALRDEAIVQEMIKAGFDEKNIEEAKKIAYKWVSSYHLKLHKKLLQKIETLKLLTPFYRTIISDAHLIGEAFTLWQSKWTSHIITGINKELYKTFDKNDEMIHQMLREKGLLEKDEDGNVADRAYSVLVKKDSKYISLAYKEAFRENVDSIIDILNRLELKLTVIKDEVFGLENEYKEYIRSLKNALNETNKSKLIKRWADVDRAWMKITSPIQIGHPLEYYEDHYRKAVALEWDVRIINPSKRQTSYIKEQTQESFLKLFNELGNSSFANIKNSTISNLSKIQLYIGRAMLYYGSEFNGLFSAQVVPNDENASKEFGKKIFAFADSILESQKAKPTMKITQIIFGDKFISYEKDLLFNKPDIWHQIYEITTIGHEFGHILWMDDESEMVMNRGGNFKNIEEFKATTGGLITFFDHEKEELKEHILKDTTKRAISLIAWMKTGEVEPYYCEGLIHLDILFKAGVLSFDKTLKIDFSQENYENAKKLYQEIYKQLATHYLNKKDANEFLSRFAKKEKGSFMPIDIEVKAFVKYYWNLYKEIGRVVL